MQTTKPSRSPLLWVPTGYFTMAMCYVMLTNVTAIMFKNMGMDNGKAAAYSSALILAYTIKPLFAPFLEMYRTKKFFVLCAQVVVGLGFAGIALVMGLPGYMVMLMPMFWALSFVGAVQDIASDGVYVTSLDSKSQSLFCGVQSLSWNMAQIVAGGGMVYLAGRLNTEVFGHQASFGPHWVEAWRVVFFLVGGITLVMAAWHSRFMPDGARAEHTPSSIGEAGTILWDSFVTLFQKKDIWKMVAFAFLFRISIGFVEKIGQFFMLDKASEGGLGLSNEALAIVYNTYGLSAMLVGSLLGGYYVARRGLKSALFPLACAINIPNVTFLLLAIYLPSNLYAIGAGVVIEKFFYGFGAVGFMIYLMQQLAPGKYATTHYAFGTGLMALSMLVTGVISGYLQLHLGYVGYFIFVMIATIPSFLAAWFAPFNNKDEDTTDTVPAVGPIGGLHEA